MRKDSIIIIGGGVAGLCAAIRLTELGYSPIVIEAGAYPSHKVCGEFFSPECLKTLDLLEIRTIPITHLYWRTPTQSLEFALKEKAGSLSHFTFDPLLVLEAKKCGAEIRTQTTVQAIRLKNSSTPFHEVDLSTGETLRAPTLIIAAGRLPQLNQIPRSIRYIGIKAHFAHLPLNEMLEMFSFSGAYLGIAPVEGGKYNVACLAQVEKVEKQGSIEQFMQSLIEQSPFLRENLTAEKCLFPKWMSAPIPDFGVRQTPDWPSTYFIGDAAGTIPPACGYGLSMAISSAYLAADYVAKQDSAGFKKAWQARYGPLIARGKWLHRAMLSPFLADPLIRIARCCPSLAHYAFQLTR